MITFYNVLAIIVPYPISTSGIILLYQNAPPPKKNNQKQRAKIKVPLRITLTIFVELIIRQ